MARIIRLRESDIANIVKKIIREGKSDKPKGKEGKYTKETPTSAKGLKKLTDSQFDSMVRKFGLKKDLKSLQSGYSKMFNMSPKWAQKGSMTPAELSKRIDNMPPEEDPKPAAWFIPFLKIFCYLVFIYCYGATADPPWWPSDIRLKENVKRTGVSESGIPIYTFNYKNSNHVWSGTMAQDLLEMGMGHAVKTMDNGYYSVNYDMIDVDMIFEN
jgi:hypothetical protein